jgi:hypothetical protein
MKTLLRRAAIGSCFASLFVSAQMAGAESAKVACAPVLTAERDVLGIIQQMYGAFRTDDSAAFQRIATADFYAYDNGARFTGQSLLDLLRKAHANGTRFEWSITKPEVHVACTLAWVTYVNEGSIDNATGHRKMTWLESAVLEYGEARQWRVRFLHSTRAPADSTAPSRADNASEEASRTR